MNFYASRFKKYWSVHEIFDFFWEHPPKKMTFFVIFVAFISIHKYICFGWIFHCKSILVLSIFLERNELKQMSHLWVGRSKKYMNFFSFFAILCMCIKIDQLLLESWNFVHWEFLLSTNSDKKFSSPTSSYGSGDRRQKSNFDQNHDFRSELSRAKSGL